MDGRDSKARGWRVSCGETVVDGSPDDRRWGAATRQDVSLLSYRDTVGSYFVIITYTYVHVMYTRVEFDFSNGVTAHTRHTQIPFCGLPIECRTLSFHRSPLPFFPPHFFPSSPPFFPFPLSLSLSLLYRRLHAMPLHVLCPLFRIIAANKMVRCGCR